MHRSMILLRLVKVCRSVGSNCITSEKLWRHEIELSLLKVESQKNLVMPI